MSNVTIHPATAGNIVLLGLLEESTASTATIQPGQRYAALVPNKPIPSATWLRAIGKRVLGNSK